MKTIHAIVKGRVQGVCFRYYTKQTADRLGIKGWVKNLYSGDVEVLAQGSEEQINQFTQWLAHGPPSAIVSDLMTEPIEDGSQYHDFQIAY